MDSIAKQISEMESVVGERFVGLVSATILPSTQNVCGEVVAVLDTSAMLTMRGVGKKTVRKTVYALSERWTVVEILALKGAGAS